MTDMALGDVLTYGFVWLWLGAWCTPANTTQPAFSILGFIRV